MIPTAQNITKALGGRWHGSYGMASCPMAGHGQGRGDRNPSLKINDQRDAGIGVRCFGGCDWRDIKNELRHRGLLPDWGPIELDPKRLARKQAERRQQDAEIREKNRQRTVWCRSIWNETQEAQNSPVEEYLRGRGINIIPPTIRYHASLKHIKTGRYFPCMVAAVTKWPSKLLSGIHRTYLRSDGSGKADVEPAKMMAGKCAGGAVRLASIGESLALCEGIETSISVMQSTGLPVWATLSTSGMRSVILPPQTRKVILCPDGDVPGEGAAREAAIRFKREGRSVHIARPPQGIDFNDLLLAHAPRMEVDLV